MMEHFKDLSNEIQSLLAKNFSSDNNKFVVEVGSNDGVMLEHLVKANVSCLGIEPSKNVAEISHQYGVPTVNKFMSVETADQVISEYQQANVIYSANVFCHIPDKIFSCFGGRRTKSCTSLFVRRSKKGKVCSRKIEAD